MNREADCEADMEHGEPFDCDTPRHLYLAAPAAALVFFCSLVGFAALRKDGYTHGTKAVSELGAVGAPLGTAFNILGFIVPGLLIVVFAAALLRRFGRKTGPLLLMASGAYLALAGFAPADLDDMQSRTSVLHAVGAMGSGVFWVLCLFWMGPLLREASPLRRWGTATPGFVIFVIVHIGWQVGYGLIGSGLPGWGQRIGFAGYFLWIAGTGLLLWTVQTRDGVSAAT